MPNFVRFLPSQILLGATLPKFVYTFHHSLELVKFREVTPT